MISSKILLTAGFDGLSKAKQVSPVSNWKANKSCLFENHTLWGEGGGVGKSISSSGFFQLMMKVLGEGMVLGRIL